MKRTTLPLFEGFIETPFEQRLEAALASGVEAEALACHCRRTRQRQNHGQPRFERPSKPGSWDDGWTTVSHAGSDDSEKRRQRGSPGERIS
jgi:hypothetical protein